jgi:hypothetical protein
MKLLIKFPTRGRKDKFFDTLKKYQDLCDDPSNTHFLISMDVDDSDMNNQGTIDELNKFENIVYFFDKSENKIHAVNRDVDKFKENWDILLLASDDMIPQVKGYDNIIKTKMAENFPDTDGVLWFNDGFQQRKLNTLCILGKKYYERFNYIYNPEYKYCWSDNEFMEVANILKKQIYFEQVIIKHEHPDWGYGKKDFIHEKNNQYFRYDVDVFSRRKKINFNLK